MSNSGSYFRHLSLLVLPVATNKYKMAFAPKLQYSVVRGFSKQVIQQHFGICGQNISHVICPNATFILSNNFRNHLFLLKNVEYHFYFWILKEPIYGLNCSIQQRVSFHYKSRGWLQHKSWIRAPGTNSEQMLSLPLQLMQTFDKETQKEWVIMSEHPTITDQIIWKTLA